MPTTQAAQQNVKALSCSPDLLCQLFSAREGLGKGGPGRRLLGLSTPERLRYHWSRDPVQLSRDQGTREMSVWNAMGSHRPGTALGQCHDSRLS